MLFEDLTYVTTWMNIANVILNERSQSQMVCPESIQPSTTRNRDLLKKIQDMRKIVHRTMTPQSPSKEAPWDLTELPQSPSAALLYFHESH